MKRPRRIPHHAPLVRVLSSRTGKHQVATTCQMAIDHMREAVRYYSYAERIDQDEKRTTIDAALYTMLVEKGQDAEAKARRIINDEAIRWLEREAG